MSATLTGFVVLTAASAGLMAIGARTALVVTAALLAVRSVSIGLVISPLLAVLAGSVEPAQLADASTVFSIWQRIVGSLGIGLIAAIFARQVAARGSVSALHVTGLVVAIIAAAGLVLAALLPSVRSAPVYGST